MKLLKMLASAGYGLSDLMRDQANKTADTKTMTIATGFITEVFGFVISVGVYLLIASQFIMTMLDLMYIALPPVRRLLVGGGGRNRVVSRNRVVNGLGHYTAFNESGNRELNKVDESTTQGRLDNAQKMESSISIDWGNRCFISSDLKSLIYQHKVVLSQNSVGGENSMANTRLNLKSYLRKRVFNIILIAVSIVLLIASNILVNTGMNVGLGILKLLGLG